jgi:5'-deoxynucleotidase
MNGYGGQEKELEKTAVPDGEGGTGAAAPEEDGMEIAVPEQDCGQETAASEEQAEKKGGERFSGKRAGSSLPKTGRMQKSHFFAYISRMRFIQRWALMRNTAPENVQEHSHQVAVLAHALAVIRNEKFAGCTDPGAVAAAALFHDASEILTGDMPTPIKYDNPVIRGAYKDVEAVAEQKLLDMLPEGIRRWYVPLLTEVDPETERLVKAADKLSAHIKCLEELKAGNAEFREAAAQTRRALEAMALPEVDYFLEVFLDSFSLTLDELK